jgi:PmbA protein
VEIFINRHTDTVCNSNGLEKTQTRYDAMVEAIPTYNGETSSVELYEQYNFAALDEDALRREISGKMEEVKARYEAITPDFPINCKIILNPEEISQIFMNLAGDLSYESVFSHSNRFCKGDALQTASSADPITLTMAGEAGSCINSRKFDRDGLSLGSIRLVESGKVMNYYGSNRYGQYLGEVPTGSLRCFCVESGTAEDSELKSGPYLEIISMSGLQLDLHSDYLGGEIRLAYYHNGTSLTPVTGISFAGKVSDMFNSIRLSRRTTAYNGYSGPEKAILTGMNIF